MICLKWCSFYQDNGFYKMSEIIESDYNFFMRLALEQAHQAYDAGEFPVGCVIVQDRQVIASGGRYGTTPGRAFSSEIDHAEIRALKNLELFEGVFEPEKAVVFSTMEPCLMCFGAIVLSGIKTIVYAYEDVMGGATTCDLSCMAQLYANAGMKIFPGVLRQKSLDLFYNFFNKETNQYWKNSYLESYTLEQNKRCQNK